MSHFALLVEIFLVLPSRHYSSCFVLFFHAGDQPQNPVQAKQVLYHQSTPLKVLFNALPASADPHAFPAACRLLTSSCLLGALIIRRLLPHLFIVPLFTLYQEFVHRKLPKLAY